MKYLFTQRIHKVKREYKNIKERKIKMDRTKYTHKHNIRCEFQCYHFRWDDSLILNLLSAKFEYLHWKYQQKYFIHCYLCWHLIDVYIFSFFCSTTLASGESFFFQCCVTWLFKELSIYNKKILVENKCSKFLIIIWRQITFFSIEIN